MQTRIDATRHRIIGAARRLVAESGYARTGVPAIAQMAGVSTGTVYRHFPSKAALFVEVFQQASRHEIEAFTAAARHPGCARQRLSGMVETFARRALRGRTLARALLVEPVGPEIDADRQRFREPYRAVIEDVIQTGIAAGQLPPQDARITATCIVGAIVETLLGPLSEPPHPEDEEDRLVDNLVQVCVNAVGVVPATAPVSA